MATGLPIPWRLSAMNPNRSIAFLDSQFQQQVRGQDFHLNPFDLAALPHLGRRVVGLATVITRTPRPANGQPT